MVAILLLSILMLFLSAALLIQSIINLMDCGVKWTFPVIASSLMLVGAFTNLICSSEYTKAPGDNEIMRGKAEYREHLHIVKGDTIKTYSIEWKDGVLR